MTQHEITKAAPLLDASGNLTEPGWARSLLPVYCRSQIRAPKTRIKEWDYYCITDGHIGLALTIADNGYMGLDSISFLKFDERFEITKSPMRLFPMGKTHLPESSRLGASEIAASGYALAFYHEDGARQLSFHMDNFRGKDAIEGIITLTDEPVESIVIATPFDKPGHFYYNQKINCLRAEGWVKLGGEKFELTPDRFFAVLDWAAACGPTTTRGTGRARRGNWTVCRSAGTSAMASAIPPPRRRTRCSIMERFTSWNISILRYPSRTEPRIFSPRGALQAPTAGSRCSFSRSSTARPAQT